MKVEGRVYTDTSKLSVRPISKSVARDIIVANHYSHAWTKVSYSFGLYVEDNSHINWSAIRGWTIDLARSTSVKG